MRKRGIHRKAAGLAFAGEGAYSWCCAAVVRTGSGNKGAAYVDKPRIRFAIRDWKCGYSNGACSDRHTDDSHGDIFKCVLAE